MSDSRGYTLDAQIACVRRELALRKNVYPKWVASGRISPQQIAAARAPLAEILGRDLGVRLRRVGGGLLQGLCPFHQERSPSFYVYANPYPHYHCFGCGAHGSAIDYVMRAKRLDFPSAVRELLGDWSPNGLVEASGEAKRAPRETEVPYLVSELWDSADAPELARYYLESRGIAQKTLPGALRGHRRVWCKEAGEFRPAMLAAVSDGAGRITALQRIWISPKLEYDGRTRFERGARCPDLSAGRKCLGPLGSGAVRLAEAGELLGLTEGVEDALAVSKLYRLPCWATCGAGRLGAVELPPAVRRVVIFADNDAPGRKAAAKAETIYRRRGYGTQSEFPERKDFCECLL